jgi:hypothetical protein
VENALVGSLAALDVGDGEHGARVVLFGSGTCQ